MRNRKIYYDIYQYASPAILTPVAYFLWQSVFGGAYHLTAVAVCVPILFAYIVPGIGTNYLKLWRFNSPMMLGNFRIHHGFVYGSAASTLAWIIAHGSPSGIFDIFTAMFVSGTVFAFWHSLYDIYAIKAGVIEVFTQARANGDSPTHIVADYGPVIFGTFGAMYVGCVKFAMLYLSSVAASPILAVSSVIIATILCVTVPTLLYVLMSYKKYGHSGLKPF